MCQFCYLPHIGPPVAGKGASQAKPSTCKWASSYLLPSPVAYLPRPPLALHARNAQVEVEAALCTPCLWQHGDIRVC